MNNDLLYGCVPWRMVISSFFCFCRLFTTFVLTQTIPTRGVERYLFFPSNFLFFTVAILACSSLNIQNKLNCSQIPFFCQSIAKGLAPIPHLWSHSMSSWKIFVVVFEVGLVTCVTWIFSGNTSFSIALYAYPRCVRIPQKPYS